ncbi:NAD(P)-dependent oxidoreductase [Komagataeibacter rhaeticus]|uniref:NAD(P)-dependent oxidoreductase n=1 Tax=Komagataeibacter rhaeticus TaxID=215221 RepID=UPI0004D5DA7F|nr:NAD(P)-dependent oxidoreductase [Komagataeibacter rhaeticus]KDU97437.1 6-phosphogluconate dehydrogenase [Komagataeibacter rhaeticus AF1]MBL7238986.1 NAD(P)-dependent oxidoreductase [Komagataeibacter rhaeticus]PYD54256.1 NAD(P)-dependent oxidoreductase [Komagataeibacter rhaeticus]GBQ14981.1 oxidoreductase [Komagataeibacter rhaeticus DSM 16663]
MKIGFVGLGAMGHPMARRLLEAGHALCVYNRTAGRADDLLAMGAVLAPTPAAAARDAAIVFSMLSDDAATQALTFGPDGIASTLGADGMHACCATVSLEQARRLRDGHAARGQSYVSANVLGRPPAAASGALSVIMGGEAGLVDRLEPVVTAFACRMFRVGHDPVQANLVKLSLNFMIMSTIEQMAEVFALNEKAGNDPHALFDIMTGSFFNAPVHRNYGQLMVDGAYDPPGAPVTLGLKDTEMFLAAGHDYHVPLPYAGIARDRFLSAMAAGDGERDFVILQECVRRDAGLGPRRDQTDGGDG